jgi:hypothetical protein
MVEQKANGPNICIDLLKQADVDENVMKLIIMGDEMWVCGYNFKQQLSSQLKQKSSSL